MDVADNMHVLRFSVYIQMRLSTIYAVWICREHDVFQLKEAQPFQILNEIYFVCLCSRSDIIMRRKQDDKLFFPP